VNTRPIYTRRIPVASASAIESVVREMNQEKTAVEKLMDDTDQLIQYHGDVCFNPNPSRSDDDFHSGPETLWPRNIPARRSSCFR
jgi:hypothetical protein